MFDDSQPTDDHSFVFRFGPFTFDCRSRLLLRDGVQQHLSPKAHRLLRLLLLASPHAVSREELYDALWPQTFVSESNLACIVNELRRTLGDDAREAQYVRTIHGFGYMFCGDLGAPLPEVSVMAVLRCEGRSHLLQEGENLVGRAVGVPVMLTHPSVSRRHARIIIRHGEVWIEDLGSKNGTYVDGQPIRILRVTHDLSIELGAVSAWLALRLSSETQPMIMAIAAS